MKIQLVDLQVYERLTPLASGLMAAAVLGDTHRAAECQFELSTWNVGTPAETIAAAIHAEGCDLVGFSTYVWNARLVRRVIRLLVAQRPDQRVLLGGPHVVKSTATWRGVAPNLLIADGEGEPILVDLVERFLGGRALGDADGVSGFWQGGELPPASTMPVADLDSIPSPFLMGLFRRERYTQAILETNRGCPFSCSFCFWGLGSKRVRRFPDERVHAELDWIFRENILSVFIADANFGMYPRDEHIATALADNRRRRGTPMMVSFNTMKNRPDRMIRIGQIVGDAGLVTTQSMAVQSMDPVALSMSGREAIRVSAYTATLAQFNREGLTTYIELIWPLPGETLSSFSAGLDDLCAIGAQSFVVYPLLSLPNTTVAEQQEELELTLTPSESSSVGEYAYVTATREVTPEEYRQGLWIILAVNLLYNTRVLAGTFDLLVRRGIRHRQVFEAFADWARDSDFDLFVRHARSVAGVEHASWAYWGSIAFEALHEQRDEFAAIIREFCAAQPWWDEEVRRNLEVDRLLLPYLFTNTPLVGFDGIDISMRPVGRHLHARVSESARAILAHRLAEHVGASVELDPWNSQLPFFANQPIALAHDYAYGQLQRLGRFVPRPIARALALRGTVDGA